MSTVTLEKSEGLAAPVVGTIGKRFWISDAGRSSGIRWRRRLFQKRLKRGTAEAPIVGKNDVEPPSQKAQSVVRANLILQVTERSVAISGTN